MLGKALLSASVSAAPAVYYVEDVFSTYLYTGNGSTQTITNDIDLAGEGGLVWLKRRDSAQDHGLFDTTRGATKYIQSNGTDTETTNATSLTNFNSDGFTLGSFFIFNNDPSRTYASWTFRKAEKFFDVVTYTGNGTAGRTVSHNLGSVPGFIIVKSTSDSADWVCYHRSLGNGYAIYLNKTEAQDGPSKPSWNQTSPTSTEFTVGVDGYNTNNTGVTYVAYLFAHDAGGFGDAGTDNVISCGSYTGNGSTDGPEIDLGWEPQWVMIKKTSAVGGWLMLDVMRGFIVGDGYTGDAGSADARLFANLSTAEDSGFNRVDPTSTGFKPTATSSEVNTSGADYIYIAIRRGPMRAPESGTEVFDVDTQTDATSTPPSFTSSSGIVDMALRKEVYNASGWSLFSRLTGQNRLETHNTDAESGPFPYANFDHMDGWGDLGGTASNIYSWMFRRAPGFFDVVAYTGTGSARTVAHSLTVAPELIFVKRRNNSGNWFTYNATAGNTYYLLLNSTSAKDGPGTYWNSTTPTSSVFSLGVETNINGSGGTFVAYLFATCPGVSKVGSYTGTGTTLSIDCGFAAGARFVLIRRTDSTGDWYVWDTARGISSGNDPYLLLNSAAAEVTNTDYIDPLSSGFQISSTAPAAINASGGSFIFLAIA